MTISRTLLCLAAGAALLAACSKPATNQAAAGGGSAPAARSGPDVTITEADLPHLKAGLWSTTSTTPGDKGPPEASTHCETGETIKPQELGKHCSQFSIKRTFLGAIVIDASCGQNGVTSTMHMTFKGDFNSSVSGDSQVSMSMPGQPAHTFATHTESHYVGPCPAGAQ
jgi:hypothetical protein